MSWYYQEDDGYSEDTDSLSFSSSAWQWQEPIVIGYAFGAKKMSTMGVVMAEASKAQVIQESALEDYYDDNNEHEEHEHEQAYGDEEHAAQEHEESALSPEHNTVCAFSSREETQQPQPQPQPESSQHPHLKFSYSSSSHPYSYPQHPYPQQEQDGIGITSLYTSTTMHTSPENEKTASHTTRSNSNNNNNHMKLEHPAPSLTTAALHSFPGSNDGPQPQQPQQQTTIFTVGASNNINNDSTNLKHIVRYFRSSCSSAAGSVTETTVSTPTIATTGTYRSSSKHNNNNNNNSKRPIRLSFVPLDPDLPLEEQHGGKLDLILHKLTEDILACSLDENEDHEEEDDNHNSNNHKSDSYRRIHRLTQYKLNHPECCMVDDPSHVKTLMSRSDIAHVLQSCLQGVTSTSGMLVQAPKFVVCRPGTSSRTGKRETERDSDFTTLQQRLVASDIQFPLIAKPLIAAGTKQSHYMTVLLQEEALHRFLETKKSSSHLLQEYVNHDATLYKVYVLGDFVSVYRRHSLPNLPPLNTFEGVECVEFDSQRPYPKLSDFGVHVVPHDDKTPVRLEPPTPQPTPTPQDSSTTTTNTNTSSCSSIPVTELEVRPIVNTLRQAFGLELFGFDILVTSSSSTNTNKTMLVVDVNYFPSYKEVPNFPTLLARYLTQRVVTSRRRTAQEHD
jgi:hypothetical protein